MPGRREPDGALGFGLRLELDGVQVAMLTEVTGLTIEREVIELREGGADGSQVVRKLPGRAKSGDVVLSRGLTTDDAFEQWMAQVGTDTAAARRSATIVVLDRQGQRVTAFSLVNAWPKKLEYTGLRVGAGEPLTERLVLVHDGIDRV